MRTKEKTRLCPFCEGTIQVDATDCKYCGSSLKKMPKTSSAYQTEDSLASLYEPPYSPGRKAPHLGISVDDYSVQEDEEPPPLSKVSSPFIEKETAKADSHVEDEESTRIGALLLLSIGGHLFTLGWLLFFFSDHGKIVLEWKSKYWFIYALTSLPLLYHGWKKLLK